MKLVKGMLIGGMISAGIVMMCGETIDCNKNKMLKKGRKLIKKMGF